jgi:hypothetical protein
MARQRVQIRITRQLVTGGETRNRRKFTFETQESVSTRRASSAIDTKRGQDHDSINLSIGYGVDSSTNTQSL